MVKPSDTWNEWDTQKDSIIGLGERSFHKSYYPQLRQNLERLDRFRTLLDWTSDFVILIDLRDDSVIDANETLNTLCGIAPKELLGKPFQALNFGIEHEILDTLHKDLGLPADRTSGAEHTQVIQLNVHERHIWLEMTYRVVRLDGHDYAVLVGRDVSERQHNLDIVEALLSEKEALLDNVLVGIVMLKQRVIISCNRRFEEIYGYAHGQLIGQTSRALYDSESTYNQLGNDAYAQIGRGQNFTATLRMARRDGSFFWGELAGRAIDSNNLSQGTIWIVSDITEKKEAEERARFLAHHDVLTGLPNDLLLQDRFQQAIAYSQRAGTKVAMMVMNIDRFKTLNEFLGRSAGDQLIAAVGARISANLRNTDTLSRQSSDEFVLLLTNLAEPDAILTFIGSITDRMTEPFEIDGKEVSTSISTGISVYPEDGADFLSLRKKADKALSRAKDAGRNTYRFFNDTMNDDAVEQVTLHSGLRRGLEKGQFVLYYQPQISLRSGKVVGAEALIRWLHPDLGLVSPARFIPVAEETGLIVEIGEWVLKTACLDAKKWGSITPTPPTIAVNLSALQFKRGNIEDTVINALKHSELNPNLLELELTESILIRDTENVLATVKRLKSLGIKLSIDDFGTGYSSLAYLKRFDVDKLKIDQTFVRGLATEQEDAAIVRAIIQMANSLGLKTIAEGVETKTILDLLKEYQCDEVQGYYYSRPIPSDEFVKFLTKF